MKSLTITRRLRRCSRITIVGDDGAALIEVDLRLDRADSATAIVRVYSGRLRRWVRCDVLTDQPGLPPPDSR